MPLSSTDWVLVGATVAGPILAVRAQKIVEALTEKRKRKLHVFRVLMATRAARLSLDHVQALNMIEMEFSSSKILGLVSFQSPKEKAVLVGWRTYFDSLTPLPDDATEDDKKRWNERTLDNFVELLHSLSVALGFDFDTVQLKKGAYWPQAHGAIEKEQNLIRESLAKILSGNQSFRMAVTDFPFSQEASDAEMNVRAAMLAALTGAAPIRVAVEPPAARKDNE